MNANTTDNIDIWQREGGFVDNWMFVGVIDSDGFLGAELRELRGKDYQQVLLFADDFSIGVTPGSFTVAPVPAVPVLFVSDLQALSGLAGRNAFDRDTGCICPDDCGQQNGCG